MPRPFKPNPLRKSDSYKDTHFYGDDVTELMSYGESRGGEFPFTQVGGLSGIIQEEFEGEFFTQKDLDEEYQNSQEHFGPGFPYKRDAWQYILDTYKGRLPIEVHAVREGSIIPTGNALFTIKSTDPKVPWIEQWTETVMQHSWYTTAVATKSRFCKEVCYRPFFDQTSDNPAAIDFILHDFGFRGATGTQAAARGGAQHLVNFRGTDTKIAMDYLHQYYGAKRVEGYSVPASEHSVMTLKGEGGEAGQVGEFLNKYPTGIISIVGDSYDIFHFAKDILCGQYRDQIRLRNGKVVCRPDSGDPVVQVPQLFDIFSEAFGFRENTKSYKVLAPCIGVLWGDGMDLYSIIAQNRAIAAAHYAIDNIVNGMGGGLLQKLNRDTIKYAIKLCNAIIAGKEVPVSKKPKTDSGKASKAGRPALLKQDKGRWVTVPDATGYSQTGNRLELLFRNGNMMRMETFDEMKATAEAQAKEFYAEYAKHVVAA
jgi:nicotinamide phosphoribosyltransferase